jgi:hypothetical protein
LDDDRTRRRERGNPVRDGADPTGDDDRAEGVDAILP